MANTINIPKAHLIMALCLPLAVVLGYFLAEPMESSSMAVAVFIFAILAVPLLMKWNHPLVVLSWNAFIVPTFLPGQPYLWMLVAPLSLLFAGLNRSVNSDYRFIQVTPLTRSLLCLGAIVMATALTTGGMGIRSLGGGSYGGKGYVYIFAAIMGYFALTSRRIPVERAGLYLAMFFLPALTILIPNVVYSAGPAAYFLYALFPAGFAMEQAMSEYSIVGTNILRIGGLSAAGWGLYGFILGRYGLRGTLLKPLPALIMVSAGLACATSGFRSSLILFLLVFAVMFYLEGLQRTRLMPVLLIVGIVGSGVLLMVADKLPLAIQRSISFLPVKVDPMVKQVAQNSTDWRLEIWQEVCTLIPQYIIKGKGYAVDPRDLISLSPNGGLGGGDGSTGMILAGDYHNGPLTLIIPFGIFGVIAFIWFLVASVRTMNHYLRTGDPRLRAINTLLLGMFVAKIIYFFGVYGSFLHDFFGFTGLIGLAVSLNGPVEEVETVETADNDEFAEPLFEGLR